MNYEKAAAFWTEKDKNAVKMPKNELHAAIEDFIKARNTCALAVADGDFIRCTPLTYKYRAGKFIIFSEGGLKFRALKENKHLPSMTNTKDRAAQRACKSRALPPS